MGGTFGGLMIGCANEGSWTVMSFLGTPWLFGSTSYLLWRAHTSDFAGNAICPPAVKSQTMAISNFQLQRYLSGV